MKLSKYITAILLYAVFILLLITAGSICYGRFDYRIISVNPEQTADSGVIAAAAEQHQVLMYTLFEKQTGTQEPELCYYTDKDRISDLQKHFGIKNGKTRTLFSFSQNVRFAPWEELDPDTAEQLTNWYLIGPEENCKACIREIRDIYTLDSFAADEDSFLKILAAILIVILVVLLCCCYMDAAFEKKEIAVRVIHGDSALRYYLKLTLTDIAVFSVIFIAGRLLQQCFTQIYKPYQYLYCLTIPFLLGICLVNLHILHIRPKEILYGRQHSAILLWLLSAVGKGAAILSCLVIVVTVPLFSSLRNYQKTLSFFAQNRDYYFIDYRSKTGAAGILEFADEEHSPREEARDFSDYGHRELNAVILKHVDPNDGITPLWGMVFCNERAMPYLQTAVPEAEKADFKQYDAVFLIPDVLPPTEQQKAVSQLMREFQVSENYYPESDRIQRLQYHCTEDLMCCSDTVYESPFDFVHLPVVCIATDETEGKYADGSVSNRYFSLSETIYRTSDPKAVERHFERYRGHSVIRNVYETFLYYYHLQCAAFFGALITILLALTFYIAVHNIILRLDYQVNATELAIRKTLGESMLQKNRRHFAGAAAVGAVNLLLAVCLSHFTHLLPMTAAIAVPVVLFALNILLICFMIRRVEKQKLTKILKGGAL